MSKKLSVTEAAIGPVTQSRPAKSLAELKSLLATIPKLGPEAEAFESDIQAARKDQSLLS